MRTIYLLRHAKSSWAEASCDDFDRPLNARGRQAAKQVGRLLRQRDIRPAQVLCSAARRTRETYAALADVLADADVCFEKGLYEAGNDRLLARLRQLPPDLPSVMVIGHNPGLERLASLLAAPAEDGPCALMRRKFPTAALAILECPDWGELSAGSCLLHDFIRPADITDG